MLFFALSCVVVSRASAQPALGRAAFTYARARGAESCPDPATLTTAVIARLGYDPFSSDAPRRLAVSIVVDHGALLATMDLREPNIETPSTHHLVSARLDCATLHPALTLAIALAIDPSRVLEIDSAPAIPAAESPLMQRPAPSQAVDPESPGPRTPATVLGESLRLSGFLRGGVMVAVAADPTTTGAFELGGGVRRGVFSIALELRGDVPTKRSGVSGELEVGRVLVQAVPCFHAYRFGLCGILASGVSIVRGHGAVITADLDVVYAAAGARIEVEVPLGRHVTFGLHADVTGLINRLTVQIDVITTYTDAPVASAFGATIGGRFGDGS